MEKHILVCDTKRLLADTVAGRLQHGIGTGSIPLNIELLKSLGQDVCTDVGTRPNTEGTRRIALGRIVYEAVVSDLLLIDKTTHPTYLQVSSST